MVDAGLRTDDADTKDLGGVERKIEEGSEWEETEREERSEAFKGPWQDDRGRFRRR